MGDLPVCICPPGLRTNGVATAAYRERQRLYAGLAAFRSSGRSHQTEADRAGARPRWLAYQQGARRPSGSALALPASVFSRATASFAFVAIVQ